MESKNPKLTPKIKRETLTVRVPLPLISQVAKYAKAHKVSRGVVVEVALEELLEKEKSDHAPKA